MSTPSAADIAARIDEIRRRPDAAQTLVGMLDERAPLYAGRGSNETERLRGWILLSFETSGLPADAVPFVLEELETGRNPYTVAAAARALRGASVLPAEAPELLVQAIGRLRGSDDVVSFDRFASAPATGNTVSVLVDLASTLALLGPRATGALSALKALMDSDGANFSGAVRAELARAMEALAAPEVQASGCCCADDHAEMTSQSGRERPDSAVPSTLGALRLENQDGVWLSFSDAFSGRPSALAFFYTRCTNPEKCSLTVTRLARLAQRVDDDEVEANIAGISYDPGFDRPARLKTYGADRGMVFSERCSLLRTSGPFDPLREAFGLGVGFGPVTVNRHRLDLVVLDSSLRVAERFERRLWHEETVLDALRAARA